jgi:hypothetical protein
VSPPSGCRFHPRCPKARDNCAVDHPDLVPRQGDADDHVAACHYPLANGEQLPVGGAVVSEDEVVDTEAAAELESGLDAALGQPRQAREEGEEK